jgi:iron transport multicopper oxidase
LVLVPFVVARLRSHNNNNNNNNNNTKLSQTNIIIMMTHQSALRSRHGQGWSMSKTATRAWLACLLWNGLLAGAATVTHDFNITWTTANPDGLAERTVIGVNGQWPLPIIRVNVGDRLVVNVLNSLGNESASLHFHGLYMRDATHMDGPAGVTQCPIPPGARFTYNFTVRLSRIPF